MLSLSRRNKSRIVSEMARRSVTTRRSEGAQRSILLHLNIYFFDLIRNNVARRARVDRLRCHDEAFLAATVLGSVKGVCWTRSRRKSWNRTRGDGSVPKKVQGCSPRDSDEREKFVDGEGGRRKITCIACAKMRVCTYVRVREETNENSESE